MSPSDSSVGIIERSSVYDVAEMEYNVQNYVQYISLNIKVDGGSRSSFTEATMFLQ